MLFKDFQEKIMAVYAAKFPKSLCVCNIHNTLGGYINIDCYLGANIKEFANGIAQNDAISVKFDISLPRGKWNNESELPGKMEIKALNHAVKHKPAQDKSYFYCEYTNISFRKTTGDAEKIIKAFERFVDRLHKEISEQYANDNLLPDDMELFARKYERC